MLSGSWIIIAMCVIFLGGVTVTYTISVTADHVRLLWCFISYTGNFPVESCIFTAVFNICAGLLLLIVFLRHSQILTVIEESALTEKECKRMKIVNNLSLAMGVTGSVGLSITGCFQQRHVHVMHMLGVVCCAGGFNAYLCGECFFTYTVLSQRTKKSLKTFRAVVICFTSVDILIGSGLVLYHLVEDPDRFGVLRADEGDLTDIFKAGIVLEWLLFFLMQMYFYSLYPDFRKIGLKKDEIVFLN